MLNKIERVKYFTEREIFMPEAVLMKEKKLSSLLAHKEFTLYLLARVISHFGDSIDSIAYSWMVYMLTGSKIMMGTLFALNFVPGILFNRITSYNVCYTKLLRALHKSS